MPTAKGLPRAGEIMVHVASGREFEIVERRGRRYDDYILVIKPVDGGPPMGPPADDGYPDDHSLLFNVSEYLHQGSWRLE